ncbi:MAG: hypothetical protein IPN90_03625 [Elusimicrobia bacterium]|nr:hypothetical protein [Elusimicrobiota bacterium]
MVGTGVIRVVWADIFWLIAFNVENDEGFGRLNIELVPIERRGYGPDDGPFADINLNLFDELHPLSINEKDEIRGSHCRDNFTTAMFEYMEIG